MALLDNLRQFTQRDTLYCQSHLHVLQFNSISPFMEQRQPITTCPILPLFNCQFAIWTKLHRDGKLPKIGTARNGKKGKQILKEMLCRIYSDNSFFKFMFFGDSVFFSIKQDTPAGLAMTDTLVSSPDYIAPSSERSLTFNYL